MGVVNVSKKNFQRASRAMLTYSENSAGALADFQDFAPDLVKVITAVES